MNELDAFVVEMLGRHHNDLDEVARDMATDAFNAGENEIAAICIIEDARGITEDELDEFLRLAEHFYWSDADLAKRVAAKVRENLRRST